MFSVPDRFWYQNNKQTTNYYKVKERWRLKCPYKEDKWRRRKGRCIIENWNLSKSKSSKLKSKKKINFFFENFDFFSKCQECLRSEGRKIFQIFIFYFLVQNDSIRKNKQFFFENFDFFSKSEECGGFWPFWPLEREPKFFLIWGFR